MLVESCYNRSIGCGAGRRGADVIEWYEDWVPEELWEHAQANFSGHLAMMFTYLAEHGLDVPDFIRYTGERAAPGWEECTSAADMMNGVLLNVLANGGGVLESTLEEDQATATVTRLLNMDVMRHYGAAEDASEGCWDKFIPIATSLGLRFSWTRVGQGYEIRLDRLPE